MKPLSVQDLEHILGHTRPLWSQAAGKQIFLSGATGLFGAWLLESLIYCNRKLDLGITATVLSRAPDAFAGRMPHVTNDPCIRMHRGDIRDFCFPQQQFDYVIHGAVPTIAADLLDPLALLTTLIDGARRIAALAQTCGATRVLFCSSGAVYGRQPESMSHIPEDYLGGPDWLDPAAVYGEGKRISEQICSLCAKQSGIQFTIARCFTFVGPHLPLDQHFAIGNFIRDALAGKNIAVRGDGTPLRSYLYMADLAIWLWTMLFRESGAGCEAFNVGSSHAISIRDLAQEVVASLNPSLKVEIAQELRPDAPRPQYVPDVRKAESLLGLRQTIGLQNAIRRTAEWYR